MSFAEIPPGSHTGNSVAGGPLIRRRAVIGASLMLLSGCASPLPAATQARTTADAQALLDASAAAHGLLALGGVADISVSYAGQWRGLVNTLVPPLVDAGHRGRSEERLLLREHLVGQAHIGTEGRKQVIRQASDVGEGTVRVWLDAAPTQDVDRLHAAALVADGYALFLLGPMLLARMPPGRLVMERAGTARITQADGDHACDLLRARLSPGTGLSPRDDLVLYIDQSSRLMRRVRFTLNGLDATQGAVAEVDTEAHIERRGVRWPTRFHERLKRPLPIPVHDWVMTGLDLDRGLAAAEVSGAAFSGRATAPAKGLA